MNIYRLSPLFFSLAIMLWFLTACDPSRRTTTLQNITVVTKDTPVTVVTQPTIKKDTVRPPVKVAWCDTIPDGQYRQLVVCYEKVGSNPIKADTIKILNTDPNALFPPQKTDTARVFELKDRYNVVIAMPFLSNRLKGGEESEIDGQSLKALEFYEGIRIAIDSLQRENVRLNVNVFDTKSGDETMKQLLTKEEFLNADLIIGPVADEQLRLVSEFALQHQIPVVSPFNPKENLIEQNPFFIQLNPTYKAHAERIMQFVNANKAKNPNLLILGTANDSARIADLQSAYALMKNDEKARIPQSISGSKTTMPSTGSLKNLSGSGLNIVIIPSFKDEAYIYNMMRELQSIYDKPDQRGKKNEHIIVFGMPQWKQYESVNIEYFDNLNLHISSEFFVDESLPENRSFVRNYAAMYGMPPREYGYIGFDVMLYFGRMLKKYGRNFPNFFFKEVNTRRHTMFNFQPVYQMRGNIDGNGEVRYDPRLIRYENDYINIVRYYDYLFQKVY